MSIDLIFEFRAPCAEDCLMIRGSLGGKQLLAMALMVTTAVPAWSSEPERPGVRAAELLDMAIERAQSAGDPQTQVGLLQAAADEVQRIVPQNSVVSESIESLAGAMFADPSQRARRWTQELRAARDLLRFEPYLEAPLPEGFPTLTPAGEVRLQEYPAYRLARTQMGALEGQAFWTLFNHIKKQEIAMTAPVEITYAGDGGEESHKSAMAFLYRSTQQGTLGTAGSIEVLEIPARMALSFGLRGRVTRELLTDAGRRLDAWLKSHATEYEVCGAMRVLEYNSPFVLDAKRFSEVQIPVRARSPATAPAR